MTPEVEKYYETYFDLFATDGWKQYIKQVGEEKDNFVIENVQDEKDLYITQGKLLVINNILNFESIIRNSYENIQEDEEYA